MEGGEEAMKKWIVILRFIPAILWMCLIFSFSAAPAEESSDLSDGISYKIVACVSKLPFVEWSEEQICERAQIIHTPVRKLAHFSEYAILAVLCMIPVWGEGKRKDYAVILGICFLYACSDEWHQIYIPGRDGNIKDVGIDTLGAVAGLLAGLAAGRIFYRRKNSTVSQ